MGAMAQGVALREAFGDALAKVAQRDERILVLDGDVGSSTGAGVFETAHPRRYLQMGIAEQNMLGVAAGLSTLGFVPFVTTFACFAVARGLDSIRVLIAQTGLNVKIVGGYAGLLTGKTGKTHQIFNDLAVMRSLPNMVVVAPVDEVECRQVVETIARSHGPAYVQITREPSPAIFGSDYRFELGRAVLLRRGRDATMVSTGVQTTRVMEAAELLARRSIDVGVLHLPTVKPLDVAALTAVAATSPPLITVEEQSILGGLGGAVAEAVTETCPTRLKRLGIHDCFGESGSNEELLEKYRLSAVRVAEDVELYLRETIEPTYSRDR
jgi:transketolase